MYRTAYIGHRGHSLQQTVAYVLGMRSGETHPQQRRYLGHHTQQRRKVDIARTVGVDVLPKQRYLAVAVVEQLARLAHDRCRVAAALHAARIRHDAVRAVVVTAAHNGDERPHAVAVESHGSYLGVRLLLRQHDVDALAARLGLAHELRQIAVGVGTGDHIDAVAALDKLLLQSLGHAADHAHDERRTLLAQPPHLAQTPPYALLGVVAYRAGVYQYDIGLFGTVGIDIAVLLHYRDDDLGIADIHLTAVGLYEQFAACARERTQCIYGHC